MLSSWSIQLVRLVLPLLFLLQQGIGLIGSLGKLGSASQGALGHLEPKHYAWHIYIYVQDTHVAMLAQGGALDLCLQHSLCITSA